MVGVAAEIATADADQVAEQRVTRFMIDRTPALLGGLTDLVGLESVDDDTTLERRPTSACALGQDGDRLTVLLGARELRMPLRLQPVMEFVREHGSFRVGELDAWLDPSSRLVGARRLGSEGLLRGAR